MKGLLVAILSRIFYGLYSQCGPLLSGGVWGPWTGSKLTLFQ